MTGVSAKQEQDYAAGFAFAEAEALAEPGDLVMTRIPGEHSSWWRSGYRAGRAGVRSARHNARTAAEATGLFAWGHQDCPGRFEYLERLPHATVYQCEAGCGQHRIAQDGPAGEIPE